MRERAAVLKGDELYKLLDELDLRYPMWRRVAIEWLDNRIRRNSSPEERARARDALRRLLAENPQVHLRPEPEPDDGQAR